jgi:antitoxin (DNA-binding transcriptional repressor) of toxin-antitoxin stability system
VIAKAGKPKAKLVPCQPPLFLPLPRLLHPWPSVRFAEKKRRFGQKLLGITYIADDFDGSLPPERQKYFE